MKDHYKHIARFKNSNVSFFYCLRRIVSNQIYLQDSYIFRLPAPRINLSLYLCWALNATLEVRCWLDMKKRKTKPRKKYQSVLHKHSKWLTKCSAIHTAGCHILSSISTDQLWHRAAKQCKKRDRGKLLVLEHVPFLTAEVSTNYARSCFY